MKDIEFSIQDIKDLLAAVNANQIGELSIEQEDFSLKIKGAAPQEVIYTSNIDRPIVESTTVSTPVTTTTTSTTIVAGNVVKSPIVGTFYESPGPDKDAYVTVGSKVEKGDVLFIIESMKLMNEVTSDFSGTVTEIHVKDGDGVEYGQPILTIE